MSSVFDLNVHTLFGSSKIAPPPGKLSPSLNSKDNSKPNTDPDRGQFSSGAFFRTLTLLIAMLKLAKNQANAKQHSGTEILLFESYSHSSFTLSSKNIRICSKNKQKNKYVLFMGFKGKGTNMEKKDPQMNFQRLANV